MPERLSSHVLAPASKLKSFTWCAHLSSLDCPPRAGSCCCALAIASTCPPAPCTMPPLDPKTCPV